MTSSPKDRPCYFRAPQRPHAARRMRVNSSGGKRRTLKSFLCGNVFVKHKQVTLIKTQDASQGSKSQLFSVYSSSVMAMSFLNYVTGLWMSSNHPVMFHTLLLKFLVFSIFLKDKEIFNSIWCVICVLLTKNVNESTGCADGYQNNVTRN